MALQGVLELSSARTLVTEWQRGKGPKELPDAVEAGDLLPFNQMQVPRSLFIEMNALIHAAGHPMIVGEQFPERR